MTRRGRESLRRAFRPAQIQLLFAGEAPPASGRFFYRGDSGLYRAMRDAFAAIDPSIAGTDFLSRFREAGCYLVDLCPEPVDRLTAGEDPGQRLHDRVEDLIAGSGCGARRQGVGALDHQTHHRLACEADLRIHAR